jgi:hypothetical protein
MSKQVRDFRIVQSSAYYPKPSTIVLYTSYHLGLIPNISIPNSTLPRATQYILLLCLTGSGWYQSGTDIQRNTVPYYDRR